MYIDKDKLLAATNGGKDIILAYYPQAADSFGTKKKFKVRETEKTASANITQGKDDRHWLVTDFGGDGKPRNAIQVAMLEEGIEFKEALQVLADRFGVDPEKGTARNYKPEMEKRPAKKDEPEGYHSFEVEDEIPECKLQVIGPYIDQDLLRKHNVYSLTGYVYTKNRESRVIQATDTYPIFMIDEGEFQKIYEPRAEKQWRFKYAGTVPKRHVFGWDLVSKAFDQLMKQEADAVEDEENGIDPGERTRKLPAVFIASGISDGLNLASLGHLVTWFNSESQLATHTEMQQLRNWAYHIYNVPDLDSTGREQAKKYAIRYIELRTLWLPAELEQTKDWRGNAKKDLKDWITTPALSGKDQETARKKFGLLMKVAYPLRFWDEVPKLNKQGDPTGKIDYKVNNLQLYNFLQIHGFFRLPNQSLKEGYTFIRIEGNVVREVKHTDIRDFVIQYLHGQYSPIGLINTFYRSTQLREASLSNLAVREVNFDDYGHDHQLMFFQNRTWRVTSEGIEDSRPGEVKRYIWQHEVIDHKVRLLPEPFTVSRKNEVWDIDIHHTDCLFFRYLINTSRMHWQRELEVAVDPETNEGKAYYNQHRFSIAGSNLSEQEQHEQKQHLVNKLYSIGYLLHRYKNPSRPWCVTAVDGKLSEEGESHGGSGKSLCYNGLRHLMTSDIIPGRKKKLEQDNHVFERINEHTDMVLIDDANQYFPFNFLFTTLTGSLVVNPKNAKQFEIPFEQVPKFCLTSNYMLRNLDPSTERRLLYTVFSDYYHYSRDGEYRRSWSPRDDFGKNLFQDFNTDDWNHFLNTCARCVQLYLNHDKIDPPMDSVTQRNLQTEMGDVFKDWADVYFSPMSGTLNKELPRHEVETAFKERTGIKMTPARFKKALKAWCKYYGYLFNPPDQQGYQSGRIIRNINMKSTEVFYIQAEQKAAAQPEPVPGHAQLAATTANASTNGFDANKF